MNYGETVRNLFYELFTFSILLLMLLDLVFPIRYFGSITDTNTYIYVCVCKYFVTIVLKWIYLKHTHKYIYTCVYVYMYSQLD